MLSPGARGRLLPRPAELDELGVRLVWGHAVSVIADANRLDPTKFVPGQLHLDEVGVGVKGVPDQLDEACRRSPNEPRQMILLNRHRIPRQRATFLAVVQHLAHLC